MREMERDTMERIGIPGIVLMENAGRAVAQVVLDRYKTSKEVIILAGPGNNGGDGFVAARYLAEAGWQTQVWLVGDQGKMTANSLTFYQACRNIGIPVRSYVPEDYRLLAHQLATADVIVDALLGTGLYGHLRPPMDHVIHLMNRQKRGFVVAVDLPSGVETDTGALLPEAVQADQTVTFAWPKWGHYLAPAAKYCGELVIADIGIPQKVATSVAPSAQINHPSLWKEYLRPRAPWSHKGTYGHLLVVGGARGMLGAATLAGLAALRTGCGLTTLAVPSDQVSALTAKVTDALVWGWPDGGTGLFTAESAGTWSERQDRFSAAAIGPGVGQFSDERRWLAKLLSQGSMPLVLDADALRILARDPSLLKTQPERIVITPHPKEMARLVGCTTEEVESRRHRIAREWAEYHQIIVVLKGRYTVIAFPDGTQLVNPTGSPALAKAGSGDVLTGIIGSLLAQDIPLTAAVPMGVYIHGLTGEQAVTSSAHSVLASDLLLQIGPVLHQLLTTYAHA